MKKQTQIKQLSTQEIQNWLVSYLSQHLEIPPEKVDVTLPFDRYRIDSAVIIGMTGDLEVLLNCILDPTLVYNYPTIELLAEHLGSGSEVDWQKNLHR